MNNTTMCDELTAKMLSGNFTLDVMQKMLICFPDGTIEKEHRTISSDQVKWFKKLIFAHTMVILIASVLGMIGNFYVIIAYLRRIQALNCCRFLNLHLACCDFTFATMKIFTAISALLDRSGMQKWSFGLAFCKVTLTFNSLGSVIAVQTILIIAAERYRAILHPLTAMGSSRTKIKISLLISWIIGIATSIPIAIVGQTHSSKTKSNRCHEAWQSHENAGKAYNIYLLIVFSILPLCLIVYCYIQVIKELNKPRTRNAIFANMSRDVIKQRRAGELRIIKMLIFVVVAFFTCVLPIRIANVVNDFVQLSNTAYIVCSYIGYLTYPLHVAVNPFIYCIKDKEIQLNCCKKEKPAMMLTSISVGKSTSVETISTPAVKLVSFVHRSKTMHS